MDKFENKNHNGMIYNGSKPVRVVQVPEDTKDRAYGGMNRAWPDRIDVRHVPNAGSNPGNPGPPLPKQPSPLSPAMQAVRDRIAEGKMKVEQAPYQAPPSKETGG